MPTPKRLYERLWQAQRGLCWICAEPMIASLRMHPLAWSYDHVQPRAADGVNKPRNKLLAHRDCNSNRGHKPIPAGISVSAFRQQQFSRLDVIDKRRDRAATQSLMES